jgi:phosphohistidine phosphatase
VADSQSPKLLLLMRHAEAVEFAPGKGDFERPLTEAGRDQAAQAGAYLMEQQVMPCTVVCSSAMRAAETAELLDLTCPVAPTDAIYNSASDAVRAEIEALPEDFDTVLVVGHAPSIPSLAHDLTDEAASEPAAVQAIRWGFPPSTLVAIEVNGPWSELRSGRLRFAAHF